MLNRGRLYQQCPAIRSADGPPLSSALAQGFENARCCSSSVYWITLRSLQEQPCRISAAVSDVPPHLFFKITGAYYVSLSCSRFYDPQDMFPKYTNSAAKVHAMMLWIQCTGLAPRWFLESNAARFIHGPTLGVANIAFMAICSDGSATLSFSLSSTAVHNRHWFGLEMEETKRAKLEEEVFNRPMQL